MPVIHIDNEATNGERFSCPLCCEDKPLDLMCVLTRCSHEQCKDCLAKWTKKAEAAGRRSKPGCPFCRVEMSQEDILAILGRPYQPVRATNPEQTEMDELTQQWIQAHTQACPHCGSHIEKESGCDKVECLCGYRFCYRCQSQDAQCNCSSDDHTFLGGECGRPVVAARDEATGQVDLRMHLNRFVIATKQKERACRSARVRMEQDCVDEFTSSALWLFCPNGNGIKRLGQHLQTEQVQESRVFERFFREEEIERQEKDNISSYGAWLFCSEKDEFRVKEQQGLLKEEREEAELVSWFAECGAPGSVDSVPDYDTDDSESDSEASVLPFAYIMF